MHKGAIGGNFLGDKGISYDNAAAWARDVRGRYAVAVNGGGKLSGMLQAAGCEVIHRVKGEGSDDDHPLNYHPHEFVMVRHRDAPPGAILYIANENRPSTALNTWLLAAMDAADSVERKVCIGNWYTHTRYTDLLLCRPAIARAARDHINGAHVYYSDGGISKSLNHDMNAWLKLAREVGGRWVLTELAYAGMRGADIDPHAGHIGRIGEHDYAALMDDAVRFYAANGAYATVFSYGRWHDFEVEGSAVLKQAMMTMNAEYPVVAIETFINVEELGELQPGYVKTVSGTFTNVRSSPLVTASTDIGDAIVGDRLEVRPNITDLINGHKWYSVRWKGQNAFIARTYCEIAAGEPDTPRANLNVPFVSQIDGDSDLINNDCREAMVAMLHRFALRKLTGITPSFPTVNALVTQGELRPRADTVTTVQSCVDMLLSLGVRAEIKRDVTAAQMVDQLRSGKPFGVLVEYSVFEPGRTFGHFCTVVDYGAAGFWIHDPYRRGANVYVPAEALLAGMRKIATFPTAIVLAA